MPLTNEAGVRIAIKTAGGLRPLARLLGNITAQAISQWEKVPAERVLEVERVTGVPRGVLRPDLYPPEQARNSRAARSLGR